MTFSSGCGRSALLLLLSVSFVQTYPRRLSGATRPSDFHLVMRSLFFFISGCLFLAWPQHLLNK